MIVHDVICNVCYVRYIEGKCFKCLICKDYNICEECMAKKARIPPCDLGHDLQDLTSPDYSAGT